MGDQTILLACQIAPMVFGCEWGTANRNENYELLAIQMLNKKHLSEENLNYYFLSESGPSEKFHIINVMLKPAL